MAHCRAEKCLSGELAGNPPSWVYRKAVQGTLLQNCLRRCGAREAAGCQTPQQLDPGEACHFRSLHTGSKTLFSFYITPTPSTDKASACQIARKKCLKGPDPFHRANKQGQFELRSNVLITSTATLQGMLGNIVQSHIWLQSHYQGRGRKMILAGNQHSLSHDISQHLLKIEVRNRTDAKPYLILAVN